MNGGWSSRSASASRVGTLRPAPSISDFTNMLTLVTAIRCDCLVYVFLDDVGEAGFIPRQRPFKGMTPRHTLRTRFEYVKYACRIVVTDALPELESNLATLRLC